MYNFWLSLTYDCRQFFSSFTVGIFNGIFNGHFPLFSCSSNQSPEPAARSALEHRRPAGVLRRSLPQHHQLLDKKSRRNASKRVRTYWHYFQQKLENRGEFKPFYSVWVSLIPGKNWKYDVGESFASPPPPNWMISTRAVVLVVSIEF